MNYRLLRTFVAAAASFAPLAVAEGALVVIPTIEVQSLTHNYSRRFTFFGPPVDVASDSFSIGDGNYTGGGAFTVPSIATGDTVSFRIQAPAGKKFVVHSGASSLQMSFYWLAGSDGNITTGGSASFENLVGSAPTNTYSFLSVGNAGNVFNVTLEYSVNGPFEFTALDATFPVLPSLMTGPRNFGSVQSNIAPAFSAAAVGADQLVMSLETAAVPEVGSVLTVGGVVSFLGLSQLGRHKRAE